MNNFYKDAFQDEQLEILLDDSGQAVLSVDLVKRTTGEVVEEDVVIKPKNQIIVPGNWINAAVMNKIRDELFSLRNLIIQNSILQQILGKFVSTGDDNLEPFGTMNGGVLNFSQEDYLNFVVSDNALASQDEITVFVSGNYTYTKTIQPTLRRFHNEARWPRDWNDDFGLTYDSIRKNLMLWFGVIRGYSAGVIQAFDENGIDAGFTWYNEYSGTLRNRDDGTFMETYNGYNFVLFHNEYGNVDGGFDEGNLYIVRENNTVQIIHFYWNGDHSTNPVGIRAMDAMCLDEVNKRLILVGQTDNANGVTFTSSALPTEPNQNMTFRPIASVVSTLGNGGDIYGFAKHPLNNYYVIARTSSMLYSTNLTTWTALSATGLTGIRKSLTCNRINNVINWVFLCGTKIFKYTGDTITAAAVEITPPNAGGTVGTAAVINAICYSNGTYYACGEEGYIGYTNNPISTAWTKITHNLGSLSFKGITVSPEKNIYLSARGNTTCDVYKFSIIESQEALNKRMKLAGELVIPIAIRAGTTGRSIITLNEQLTQNHYSSEILARNESLVIKEEENNHLITMNIENNYPHNEIAFSIHYGDYPDLDIKAQIYMRDETIGVEQYVDMEVIDSVMKNGSIEKTFYYMNDSEKENFTIQLIANNPYSTSIEINAILGYVADEIQYE